MTVLKTDTVMAKKRLYRILSQHTTGKTLKIVFKNFQNIVLLECLVCPDWYLLSIETLS